MRRSAVRFKTFTQRVLSSRMVEVAQILERFGEPTGGSPTGVAVRLQHGARELADIVRALDSAGVEVEHIQLHAPSLDDVFLAKTGRSLEGAAEEEEARQEETEQ